MDINFDRSLIDKLEAAAAERLQHDDSYYERILKQDENQLHWDAFSEWWRMHCYRTSNDEPT